MTRPIPADRLPEILDVAEDGIITVDARQTILLFNRGAVKLFGYEPAEVIGQPLNRLLPQRYREAHTTQVAEFGRASETSKAMGHRRDVSGRRKDGTEFPAEVSISKSSGADGLLFTAIVRDIMDRRRWESERQELAHLRAQAELHATRAKLDAMVLAARDGIVMLDAAGTITFVNEAVERLFGVPRSEALAKPVTVLMGTGYTLPTDDASPDPSPVVEFVITRGDGTAVPLELARSRIHDDGQVAWLLIARDLSERRRTEENLRETTRQLWQAARLAGVGELAASIAHELNNPLGTVSLRMEQVLAKTTPEDPRRRALEVVEAEVRRMADLVGNLLQFSRAGREQVSTVDVPEEIGRTLELIDHHFRKRRIAVESDYAADVPLIQADRQHLRQVFLNLFTNAADAMPAGGQLALRVRSGRLPSEAPAIVVEVADTGTGIPPDLLGHVFEAFFTTKDEGKGTGLGLAICRRIVEQHHGVLEAESAVGQGTTIRMTLPLRSETNVAGLHRRTP
jgi:PAS domain S-box-containing protein